ncbi:hypothetical protein [Hugenholtzia roseola]|uniref:hypothetical protein n=1 Tax=Hugenholtzia roseola TaxID=1002 RepID=UPI0003FC60E6|nr:hypothetical protein [Hugenholtzia roseola]
MAAFFKIFALFLLENSNRTSHNERATFGNGTKRTREAVFCLSLSFVFFISKFYFILAQRKAAFL